MNDPRDINDPQCAAWYRTSPLWQIWTTGHRDGPVERTAWAMAVASLLPPAWIAFDATLTNIEDLLAPLAVRLVANWRPGRVPLFCECYDVLLLAVAIDSIVSGIHVGYVVVAYLILASPIPLVLDVSEEMHGAEGPSSWASPRSTRRSTSERMTGIPLTSGPWWRWARGPVRDPDQPGITRPLRRQGDGPRVLRRRGRRAIRVRPAPARTRPGPRCDRARDRPAVRMGDRERADRGAVGAAAGRGVRERHRLVPGRWGARRSGGQLTGSEPRCGIGSLRRPLAGRRGVRPAGGVPPGRRGGTDGPTRQAAAGVSGDGGARRGERGARRPGGTGDGRIVPHANSLRPRIGGADARPWPTLA